MSHGQTILSHSSTRDSYLSFFKPAPAWAAIFMLFLFTALCLLAGAGSLLNVAFPVGSLAVGAFLYFRYPILYIGFTWWIWFITGFVRRLADYRSSYTEPSPLLLAPYLVTALTLVTVFRYLPKARREGGLSFILPLVGVFYGFLIGLINYSPFEATRGLLDWLTPITFGFHLLINWRNFPSYYKTIQRTFVWGILVMGIYGIAQYALAPEWDRSWLINSGMTSSGGAPVAFGMRVFSTMNSIEPFSAVMAAGLLLLFNKPGVLNLFASGAGYLSFLLSLTRSAWIGWLAGLLTLGSSLKAKNQMRLFATIAVLALIVLPLTTVEPFSATINKRAETLSNVQEDGSYKDRTGFLNATSEHAFTNLFGDGINSQFYDSALLGSFLNLGWLGTICYFSGMLSLILKLFQNSQGSSNFFTGTARAIVMSCLVRIPVNGSSILGIGGLLLWGFLALNIASQKYYLYQHTPPLSQPVYQNSP
jgi:hypothetical protein